jgi:hypothetical protein
MRRKPIQSKEVHLGGDAVGAAAVAAAAAGLGAAEAHAPALAAAEAPAAAEANPDAALAPPTVAYSPAAMTCGSSPSAAPPARTAQMSVCVDEVQVVVPAAALNAEQPPLECGCMAGQSAGLVNGRRVYHGLEPTPTHMPARATGPLLGSSGVLHSALPHPPYYTRPDLDGMHGWLLPAGPRRCRWRRCASVPGYGGCRGYH